MDVVNARPDFVRIFEAAESFEQLHIRTRGLYRDDIGVQRGDRREYVVELRITHVRVDLHVVHHAGTRDAKRAHRPLKIFVPLRFLERQPLAKGRLIDLYHADTGLLEIGHLFPDRQRDLQRGLGTRPIVAHE